MPCLLHIPVASHTWGLKAGGLQGQPWLPEAEVKKVLLQVVDAVHYCHRRCALGPPRSWVVLSGFPHTGAPAEGHVLVDVNGTQH